jgi:hypothetical protein
MVTAVNNAFGERILDTTEVIDCALELNESNKKGQKDKKGQEDKKDKKDQEVNTYGSEKGFFHFHTIQICLHRKGYKLEEIKGNIHTHTTLSQMDKGKYIAMGWSDPINVHAIAIDCDNSLCICDTQKGYLPRRMVKLSSTAYSVSKIVVILISTWSMDNRSLNWSG